MASAETKEWSYLLIRPNGKSLYVQNGVVKESGLPVPVQHAPDGWKDYIVSYERNTGYFGIIAAQAVPLRFYKDASYILRTRLYNNGAEDVVYVVISRLNRVSGVHELFYKAEVNFNEYTDDLNFFQVVCQEPGLHRLLKAYESTPYQIPFTECIYLRMGGLKLAYKQPLAELKDFEFTAGGGAGNVTVNYFVPFVLLTGEGTPTYLDFNGPTQEDSGNDFFGDDHWSISCKESATLAQTIVLKGTFTIKLVDQPNVGHASFGLKYSIATATANVGLTYRDVPDAAITDFGVFQEGDTKTVTLNWTIILNPGEFLYITARSFADIPANGLLQEWNYGEGTLTAYTEAAFNSTIIRAMKPVPLGQALLADIVESDVNNVYDLQSPFLDQSTIVCTSGDALRGIPGAVIKTTFKDFFNSYNRNLNIGLNIAGNTAFIKAKADYYNTTLIYHLGNVKDIQFSYYQEVLFNALKAGYPTEENATFDNVNGRYETNATQHWSFPITRIAKELDLSQVYRADPYGIEKIRINLEGKTTTDNSGDNGVFMLDVEPTTEELTWAASDLIAYLYVGENQLRLGTVVEPLSGIFTRKEGEENSFIYSGPSFTTDTVFVCTYTGGGSQQFDIRVNGVTVATNTGPSPLNIFASFALKNGDVISAYITASTPTTIVSILWQIGLQTVYQLRRLAYTSITGVGDPTGIYNVELRPKNQILNYGNWLRGCLWPYDNKYIAFQTADKNKDLVTTIGGVTITESADILIGDLDAPLFRPIVAKFETVVPQNLVSLMATNAHGLFSFNYNGKILSGFVIAASQKPADNAPQQWTLLLSPDTKMEDLIH